MAYNIDVLKDDKDNILRPATITDNVVNPNSRKSVTEELATLGSKTAMSFKILSAVNVPSDKLNAVEGFGIIPNKVLYNNGNLSTFNGLYVTEPIDVSNIELDYYVKFDISVNQNYGKVAFYTSSTADVTDCIYCINGGELSNNINNKNIYKLNIPVNAKYMRVSGNHDNSFHIFSASKVNSIDEFGFANSKEVSKLLFLSKILSRADVPSSSFEDVSVTKLANKLLSSGGERVFDQNNFCTTDFVDVSNALYDYYITPNISVSSSFGKIGFYYADKTVAFCIHGGDLGNETNGTTFKLNLPLPIKYVRVSGNTIDSITIKKVKRRNSFETGNTCFTSTNKVLWLGTSIPASGEYPEKSCQANGYECIKMALGESALTTTRARSLTATVDEIQAKYGGTLSQGELELCKNHSYERAVLPYINGSNENQVSAIVIDHGYNDYQNIIQLMENPSSIDWDSTDRNNFVGAFNYLINEIQKVNPFIKIVISGYFCYTMQSSNKPLGRYICDLQRMIADKYNIELMDAWNYTQISFDKFIAGTADYFTKYNAKYGTSITPSPWWYDANGNIRSYYIYCPDQIHPHSDKTGNSNKRLDAVYSKLLSNII